MEFKYCDRNGNAMGAEELEKLMLWNPVMEHILAGVLQKGAEEESTSLEWLVE